MPNLLDVARDLPMSVEARPSEDRQNFMPGVIPIFICVAKLRNYLSIGHRGAPSVDGLQLALRVDEPALALEVVEQTRRERSISNIPGAAHRTNPD
jgi:hypothetical protein